MKNVEEWSVAFDQYYNNITSNQAPGLTEFEKSNFLTDAQEAVVTMLYNGSLRHSFEETEEITNYLSPLVAQSDRTEWKMGDSYPHIISETEVYSMPSDMLFRTLELCTIKTDDCGNVQAIVEPVPQDEFWRRIRNPFTKPNEHRVLRLAYGDYKHVVSNNDKTDYSELYSKYPIVNYTVRYIKRPEPIILTDLRDGLTIRGKSTHMTCQLDEALHHTILMEAVKLAKAVWNS